MLVQSQPSVPPSAASHGADPGMAPLSGGEGIAGAAVPGTATGINRRQVRRQGVLLAARLDVGGSALDCIVLDISPRGARVQFGAPVTVPEQMRLMLRDGSRYDARRCWSRGNQMGLEFLSTASLNPDEGAARRVRAMVDRVRATDPAAWLPALRAERYFGDEALRHAAEAAEIAHLRLMAALRAHSGDA